MCLTFGFRRIIVKGFQGSIGPSNFSNTRAETDHPPYIGVPVVEGRPNALGGGPQYTNEGAALMVVWRLTTSPSLHFWGDTYTRRFKTLSLEL